MAFLGFVFSILLLIVLLPYFNQITNIHLSIPCGQSTGLQGLALFCDLFYGDRCWQLSRAFLVVVQSNNGTERKTAQPESSGKTPAGVGSNAIYFCHWSYIGEHLCL